MLTILPIAHPVRHDPTEVAAHQPLAAVYTDIKVTCSQRKMMRRTAPVALRRQRPAGGGQPERTTVNIQILNAPGQLFLGSDSATAHAQGARHFRSAIHAIRFAMEHAAPVSLRGAMLEIGAYRLGPEHIRRLHSRLTRLGQARRPGATAADPMGPLADYAYD